MRLDYTVGLNIPARAISKELHSPPEGIQEMQSKGLCVDSIGKGFAGQRGFARCGRAQECDRFAQCRGARPDPDAFAKSSAHSAKR